MEAMRPLLIAVLLAAACSDSSAAETPPEAIQKTSAGALVEEASPDPETLDRGPAHWSCWSGRTRSGINAGYCFETASQCEKVLADATANHGVTARSCYEQPYARCYEMTDDLKGDMGLCFPSTELCEETRPPVGGDVTSVGPCEKLNVSGYLVH